MKSVLTTFAVLFSCLATWADCPHPAKGMESEPELSRIEAATDFTACNETQLEQLDERLAKQVNLFCPAGLKSLSSLDLKSNSQISQDDIRNLLSCSSRKASLALIREQRARLGFRVHQAIKGP